MSQKIHRARTSESTAKTNTKTKVSEESDCSDSSEIADGGTGSGGANKPKPKPKPKPQGYGVLPYASELFGVYQPLIGWKSQLSHERLGTAVAKRTLAAANAIDQAEPPTPDNPVPRRSDPRFADRTGTRIGDEIARHLQGVSLQAQSFRAGSGERGSSEAAQPDVTNFLKKTRDSKFFQLTKHILKDVDSNSDGADTSGQIRKEAAMATVLHDLAVSHPQALQRLFVPDISKFDRIKAAISLFTNDESPSTKAFLSPIGILHLFREYFFQLGTFKGEPCGHVWLSPGSSLELIEVNTRRRLEERTIEQSTETTSRSEVDITEKDELSDAVKTENSNNTSLGASVSGGGGMGIWHATASASFNVSNARKQAAEQTHTRMREQSSKLSNEIKQNYKTTFRTVTETTDSSSRRYLLQNTSQKLVSYELSRKMRKVGVQVQDLGRRLCWQLYVDNPGDPLGVGEFVYASASALDSSVKRPDKQTYPTNIEKPFSTSFPYNQTRGGDDDTENTYVASPNNKEIGVFSPVSGEQNWVEFKKTFKAPPSPAGFVLKSVSAVDFHGANVTWDSAVETNSQAETFTILLTSANFNKQRQLPFDVSLVYEPTEAIKSAIDGANSAAKEEYKDAVAAENETKFFDTLRARLKLVSQVRVRSQSDLREEERNMIYRSIISRLYGKESSWDNEDYHVASEIIRYFFDIDSMLYFVAPDWWKPRTSKVAPIAAQSQPSILAGKSLTDRIQLQGSGVRSVPVGQRPKYLITEETAPAPLGSSLGWLMQIDGDRHRNAFLNSPWVKAVIPMRPGREAEAIKYMKRDEVAGKDGLGEVLNEPGSPFDGWTMEAMVLDVAAKIKAEHEAREPKPTGVGEMAALPEEMVYSKGYNPLEGGTKFDKDAFEVFSEWLEVLPTDQVVAYEWTPDGSTTTPIAVAGD